MRWLWSHCTLLLTYILFLSEVHIQSFAVSNGSHVDLFIYTFSIKTLLKNMLLPFYNVLIPSAPPPKKKIGKSVECHISNRIVTAWARYYHGNRVHNTVVLFTLKCSLAKVNIKGKYSRLRCKQRSTDFFAIYKIVNSVSQIHLLLPKWPSMSLPMSESLVGGVSYRF